MSYPKGGERAELKHLSRRREENKSDFRSSGERNGNSPNQDCFGNFGVVGLEYGLINHNGTTWNG